MATQARFGRLPRSAPSLTSTIVALAQEYQRTRDRNIEDAWENGGAFEGHKVTDEQFLSYWKERLSGVSQDDPMWDYYNNLIHGYEFQIAESKMGLKYAREDVSDAQMAAFYAKWANKMPKNSENYRTLMTQAAKFRSAANARATGGRQRASAEAYNKAQQNTYNKHEAGYDVATLRIAQYAVVSGYLDAEDLDDPDHGWSKLTNARGENDPANFAALLTDIMGSPQAVDALTKEIRQYDPTFDGTFTDESLAKMANNARNGAQIRANRARKAGDKTGANAAEAAVDNYAKSSMVIRATKGQNGANNGFIEQNEHMRAQMDAILDPNSGASPGERQAAIDRYKGWLTGDGIRTLGQSLPPGSVDPASKNFNPYIAGLVGRINNTVSALDGKPTGLTLKDDALGFSTAEAGAESDAATLGTKSSNLRRSMDMVGSGKAIVVQTDKSGNLDPNGTQWSVFDLNDPQLQKAGNNLIPIADVSTSATTLSDGTTVGGANGETRFVLARPIKVKTFGAQDPNTGEFVNEAKNPNGTSEEIGTHLVWNGPGGVPIEMWGIYQGGRRVWTTQNPFQAGGQQTVDKDGSITMNFVFPGTVDLKTGKTTQPVTPLSYIDPTTIKNPNNSPNWNPQTDKQTGYDSPMAAFANSSAESLKRAATMGDKAIRDAEMSWYADPHNWTPDMQQKVAAGMDPTQVVQNKSSELVNTIQFNRTYGYTPEDQQRTRTFMQQRAESEAAGRMGLTVDQWKARNAETQAGLERTDLITQVQDWTAKNEKPLPPVFTAGVWGGQPPSTLPKGWTVASLLNQPGMSTAQANDIAARITNGALGSRLPQTDQINPWAAVPLLPLPVTVKKDQPNPYMPGTPEFKPKQGPPTPLPVTPKPEPKPTNTPNVNAQTGFTVPKTASGFTGTKTGAGGRRETWRNGELISVSQNGRTML